MPEQEGIKVYTAAVGLNTENSMDKMPAGTVTYSLNAVVESFSGDALNYQTEAGNTVCVSFPEGYSVVGVKSIPEKKTTLYMLASDGGNSQIGTVQDDSCEYVALIDDSNGTDKLGFTKNHPILQIQVKTTNCTTKAYWTDNNMPRYFLDFENLPWKEQINPNNAFQPILLVGQLDINKMLVQPNFSVPSIKAVAETSGGVLKKGSYQATVQYANILGEGYTSFYNVSNPISIYENQPGDKLDGTTSKAITFEVTNLDTSGLYDFFNVAIIKTINGTTSYEYIAKNQAISGPTARYVYTGTEPSPEQITATDIFNKYQYYDKAKGCFVVDNVLGWNGLSSAKNLNYQEIWSNVELLWETHKIPYSKFEAYNNGLNTQDYKGYMRDEVYAFEGCFILKNGMQTKSFHIPGRMAQIFDRQMIPVDNLDNSVLQNPCDSVEGKERWKVYNTGQLTDYSQEFKDYKGDLSCYKGKYQYGRMAYWESTELYPNNPLIWGSLANTPIRHHKFPDSIVTHIHDNNTTGTKGYEHSIFPIGVRIEGLYDAIKRSSLSQKDKDDIVGFKIARGNRANEKSVIAKGLLNNVGKYTYVPEQQEDSDNTQTYYFPNYPYNDLRKDPYFTKTKIKDHTGFRPDASLNGFDSLDSKSRFTFHSPDTHFEQPRGIDSGYLKLETIEYGESYGHFVKVDENAKYLFINKNGYRVAYGVGIASVINGKVTYNSPWDFGVGADTTPANFAPTYQAMLEVLGKILPYNNLGYSFNSYGDYNKAYAIPNSGNKIRRIGFGKYIRPEYENIEAGNIINNYQRESSIYLNTTDPLLYTTEYSATIPADTSRYNLSSAIDNDIFSQFFPLFVQDHNLVTVDNVSEAAISITYAGPTIITFYIKDVALAHQPAVGDTFNYIDKNNNVIGSFLVQSISTSPHAANNGFTIQDLTIAGILTSGNLTDILNTLQLAPTTNNIGTSNADIAYSNPSSQIGSSTVYDNKIAYISGNLSGAQDSFFKLVQGSYQSYISTNGLAIAQVIADVGGIYNNVFSQTDLEALEIENPSTIDDYNRLVAYAAYIAALQDYQAAQNKFASPDKIRQSSISSYYGSIKRELLNQWGQIYSYETIDTGYFQKLTDEKGEALSSLPTVFGGDIFINRFGLKSKLPIFEENTVTDEDQTDIEYDKIANFTYPMFWHSTRPAAIASDITSFIEKKAQQVITNGDTLDAFQLMLAGLYGLEIAFEVIKSILGSLGVRNLNLDNFQSKGYYEQGIIYLFVYGIPYFFVESEINVDYRQATNSREGDFYPNVSGDIPDEWVQEANVSIEQDNTYNYNISYSKQNKENYFPHLRADYDPNKLCYTQYPNRAIWSEQSNLEETRDHWLTYRPASVFDFPKSFGNLTSLDTISNKQVLARFENRSQLYNALTTIPVSQGPQAYLGNDKLFSGQPLDLSVTDGGQGGSQNIMFLKTPYGNIYIDAIRGAVILLTGESGGTDLADKGMSKWLASHLPFEILTYFPDINVDNAFNSVGVCGVYDALYKRVLISKKDYIPLVPGISHIDGKFYIGRQEIFLTDSTYFCNRGWTLSYSFLTNSWISFHSYIPSYYVPYPNYFHTGSSSGAWEHNRNFLTFNKFYGKAYPFIIEYPIAYGVEDEITQSIQDYCKAAVYTTNEIFHEPAGINYYNKCYLYNRQQHTGMINLIPKPKNSLSFYGKYPVYNSNSRDILVSKSDHMYRFNQFCNIQISPDVSAFTTSCELHITDKEINEANMDYSKRPFKANLRSKELKLRLIQDARTDVKLISTFILSPSIPSKI